MDVLSCLSSESSVSSPCWVGRTREIALCKEALTAACRGRGQWLFLEGEAGNGATPGSAVSSRPGLA